MDLLKRYTDIAKDLSASQLFYALKDVMVTLELMESDPATRDSYPNNPYLQKLYAEKDAYSTEIQRRRGKL